jgi:hypothetical protein
MNMGADLKSGKLPEKLQILGSLDGLTKLTHDSCPCYAHRDHRFTLPIARFAQDEEHLPKPCTLVLFDAHHDAVEPDVMADIADLRRRNVPLNELVQLCSGRLRQKDDDWVKAGMELGLFRDVVIFGAELNVRPQYLDTENSFSDHTGEEHRLEICSEFLGSSLEYQGDLGDLCRRQELAGFWDILGWNLIPQKGFTFAEDETRILLSIDLDYFVVRWGNFLFPWPNEVFKREFHETSDYGSTNGWTGKMFFNALAEKAGLIDIALEPSCCGGIDKAYRIFASLNHHLFDDRLDLQNVKNTLDSYVASD